METKKFEREKKLADGKTIGGADRLTGVKIDKLQVYYGLAIRRNNFNLQGMKTEILAGLYHSASTDYHPQHDYCLEGPDSWCKFVKIHNKATNTKMSCQLPS